MKVWEEDEVLEELVAARMAAAATMSSSEEKKEEMEAPISRISFLLILARKYHRKHYEFVYYPAETYARIEELFDATAVVLEDGTLTGSTFMEDEDPMVWIGHASSSDEEEDEEKLPSSPFEAYFVGKAIFHTDSGEPLMKMMGSPGWREALKQKYHTLDVKSREKASKENEKKEQARNHTAAKAVAAAAIGGGAATGGTALAAGAMGYTATGIAANSAAATIMSMEAAATGGGVAAGGFTATMQTIGAVGVMASPVGMTLAAGGAIVGLGSYYLIHRRNRRKREEEDQKAKELAAAAVVAKNNKLTQGEETTPMDAEEQETNEYVPLQDDEDTDHNAVCSEEVDYWLVVDAKRVAMEESEHCFDHSAFEDQAEAEKFFQAVSSNTAAKALFDPHGRTVEFEANYSDKDGWEMALRLHYNFLLDQGMIPTTREKHGEGATEETPLLTEE